MSLPQKMKADLSGRIPQVYTIRSSTQRLLFSGSKLKTCKKSSTTLEMPLRVVPASTQATNQDILTRYNCQFRNVAPAHYREYFGWAIWFYEKDPFPVLQCFWPDRDGHYPWNPECPSEIALLQPLLFKPS